MNKTYVETKIINLQFIKKLKNKQLISKCCFFHTINIKMLILVDKFPIKIGRLQPK